MANAGEAKRTSGMVGRGGLAALLVALALSGCGGAAGATRAQGTPAEGAAPVAATPTLPLLRALADGSEPFAAHVDAARGVLFVEVFTDPSGEDPRIDANGEVRVAERLCGAALATRLERVVTDLHARFESGDEEAVVCEGDTCRHHAAMEYDSDGVLVFRAGTDGAPVLDRVVRTEGGPVSDEWRATAQRWADERVAALSSGACAP